MSQPKERISEPSYWRERLRQARTSGHLHEAIFRCSADAWRRIEEKHRLILAERIGQNDSVLDCGCGWGRLLDLMPRGWGGAYLGIDLSVDFVDEARLRHERPFVVADLRDLEGHHLPQFDWAVLISMRPMIRRNLGGEEWDRCEAEVRKHAKRLLYLEYDENDEGSLE